MKLIKNIPSGLVLALSILVAGLFASCKSYLEYQSPSKLGVEETFEDVNYTNSQVIGIYTMLCGSNAYGNNISVYFQLGADDFTYRGSASFDGTREYAYANYGLSSLNTGLYNTFIQLYAGIERANIACKYIPASKLYQGGNTEQQKIMRRYYGEALTLRAQYYYELIRNWGDVPATFVPAADLPTQFLTHSNRDSTYDRLLDDLKIAADMVPWRDELPDYKSFRITKGAVKGLRARIALARGGYSLRTDTKKMERRADYQKYYKIAFDECNGIIESGKHGLNPVYENIFKSLHTGTGRMDDAAELMFEVAMWGQVNDSNLSSANGLSFSNSPSWGNAGGRGSALPTYFYEFENGKDIRRDVTVAAYKVQGDAGGTINQKILISLINFNSNKFRKSWTQFDGKVTGTYGVNWPVLRYADILLMYAEAANELQLTGVTSPLAALQLVQKRAYGTNPLPVTPIDKDGFFKAVVKERLLEFGGEGIRKYDLIRWNLLASTFAETKAKMALMATNAPVTDNPYANYPQYVYAAPTTFNNTDLNTEAATLSVYGGVPNTVFFTPMTVTTNPAGFASRLYWRQELGSWTNGVLTSPFINDPNTGYVCKFQENSRELFPYPYRVIMENRGSIVQNFGYND